MGTMERIFEIEIGVITVQVSKRPRCLAYVCRFLPSQCKHILLHENTLCLYKVLYKGSYHFKFRLNVMVRITGDLK